MEAKVHFKKHFFLFILMLISAYASFSSEYVEKEEKLSSRVLILTDEPKVSWPLETPEIIKTIPLSGSSQLNRAYRILSDIEKEAYSKSIDKIFASYDSHLENYVCVSLVASYGNAGYLPAFIRLSQIFREGFYGVLKNDIFAINLLKLVPIDEYTVNFFDQDSVRILLQNLNFHGLKQKEIAEELCVSNSTISRFFSGAGSPIVLKNFKEFYFRKLSTTKRSLDYGKEEKTLEERKVQ